MKSISGKLVFVQPISLSKAARYIYDFASFENNGASDVVSIYLDHASEAFTSLVQMHKHLHSSSTKKHVNKNATINHDEEKRKNRMVEDMGTCNKKRKKKLQKKESVAIKEIGREGRLEVEQERESKRKNSRSVDPDGQFKDEPIRMKHKSSKV